MKTFTHVSVFVGSGKVEKQNLLTSGRCITFTDFQRGKNKLTLVLSVPKKVLHKGDSI